MSAITVERLTLAEAAARLHAMKRGGDEYRRATRLGPHVARYLQVKQVEEGAQANTIRTYEGVLRRLCVEYAGLEPKDFEPPVGTDWCREFILSEYTEYDIEERVNGVMVKVGTKPYSGSTRSLVHAVLTDFFSFLVTERTLSGNPMLGIKRARKRGIGRKAMPLDRVATLLGAQKKLRDRIGVQLLLFNGLRREELRLLQFQHIDLTHGEITLVGAKGGGVPTVELWSPELRNDLEREIQDRQAKPDEYLLYPIKLGRQGTYPDYQTVEIRADRHKPLSHTAIHNWWKGCLERAELPAMWKLHEMRHTAISAHARANKDPQATQRFARHKSIATTMDIYGHLFNADYQVTLNRFSDYLDKRMGDEE